MLREVAGSTLANDAAGGFRDYARNDGAVREMTERRAAPVPQVVGGAVSMKLWRAASLSARRAMLG
jgi:hypothetical protein